MNRPLAQEYRRRPDVISDCWRFWLRLCRVRWGRRAERRARNHSASLPRRVLTKRRRQICSGSRAHTA